MSVPKYNFIFLLHVSRSGSTYLSRLLAENCSDLVFIPETNFFRIFLLHQRIYKKFQPSFLAKLLIEDPKFRSFQFSKKEIIGFLDQCKTYREAILATTKFIIYKASIKEKKNILIKDGGLLDFVNEINTMFPGSKFIHLQRDPRGCINSLLHTPKAFIPGKSSMGWNDIEMCVRHYEVYLGKIETLTVNNKIMHLQYEDLLGETNEVLLQLIKDLCLRQNHKSDIVQWIGLREEELVIHKNLYKPAQKHRLTAWKHELETWEIIYIERKLLKYIDTPSVGYSKKTLLKSLLKARLNHILGWARFNVYRLNRYLLNGNLTLFFYKVRLKLKV
jgi:hypothetical protein